MADRTAGEPGNKQFKRSTNCKKTCRGEAPRRSWLSEMTECFTSGMLRVGDRINHTTRLHWRKPLWGGWPSWWRLSDGRIKLEDFACEYIPAWKNDSQKSKITIRHLATHSAGIEDAEVPGKSHEELAGWKGEFWHRHPDPFSIALSQAPITLCTWNPVRLQ